MRVLVVVGTRPEAVKMAPVIRRLRAVPSRYRVRICAAGQHSGLLAGTLADLGLRADTRLRLMRPGQSIEGFLGRAIPALAAVVAGERPGLVLAEGDTATVLAAALASFLHRVPFGHVEAGLRSFDKRAPFPEEQIRVLVDGLSDLLFAPTAGARRNLLREGFDPRRIEVTGNTVVDSLLWAAARRHRFRCPALRRLPPGTRLATVTLHRRESHGPRLRGLLAGIRAAADRCPELRWVLPVHPNPAVGPVVRRLLRHPRVALVSPLGYLDFVHLMKRSEVLLTDSGGVQEEGASLGKTVLVLREKTERPEALRVGARLVGYSRARLLRELGRALRPRRRRPAWKNPFGDGRAAERIERAIRRHFL